jgi:hypothetical protein
MKKACISSPAPSLPAPILGLIWGYLPLREVIETCRLVCTTWHKVRGFFHAVTLCTQKQQDLYAAIAHRQHLTELSLRTPWRQKFHELTTAAINIEKLTLLLRTNQTLPETLFQFPRPIHLVIKWERFNYVTFRTVVLPLLKQDAKFRSISLKRVDRVFYADAKRADPDFSSASDLTLFGNRYLEEVCLDNCDSLDVRLFLQVISSNPATCRLRLRNMSMSICNYEWFFQRARSSRKQWHQLDFSNNYSSDEVADAAAFELGATGGIFQHLEFLGLSCPLTAGLVNNLNADVLRKLYLQTVERSQTCWLAIAQLKRLEILAIDFNHSSLSWQQSTESFRYRLDSPLPRLPKTVPASRHSAEHTFLFKPGTAECGEHILTKVVASLLHLRVLMLGVVPDMHSVDIYEICCTTWSLRKFVYLYRVCERNNVYPAGLPYGYSPYLYEEDVEHLARCHPQLEIIGGPQLCACDQHLNPCHQRIS